MNKPNRHPNHILETESNKFFNNHVPNEWYLDKPDHDYGVDFIANIVINNQVTGLNFSVQLKGKGKETAKDFTSITLKHSTLGLYNTRLEPILLVAYIREEKEAYWFWYNDLNIDLPTEQKPIKVKIPKTNKLSLINWNQIIKYVQNIFSIKTLVDGIKYLEYYEISNSEILAWKHYYSGDYENASFYFKNLLKNNPKNIISVLEGLAHSQYMSYQYKEALQNINKAIELSGTPSQFLTKACISAEDGISNKIKGKLIEAKNIFKRFIDKYPHQEMYHYNFANTLGHLEETDDSIKHYIICLKLNPNNAQAWKNLGSVYFDNHNHKEEIICYDKALAINPNLAEALFSKGITLSHIFNQNEEGLSLMIKAIEIREEMIINFPRGYFWLAYVNEKLHNLKESLSYINTALDHMPEDTYMLNFKSYFLASHWNKKDWIKEEAIHFFEYRLELENDYESLYYLIIIKEIFDKQTVFDLIKKHTQVFKSASQSTLEKCDLSINDFVAFLLHYDKYLRFRNAYPINRCIDHLISEHYSMSMEFLEVLDFIFAISFSKATADHFQSKDPNKIGKKILDELSIAPKAIFELIPDGGFSQKEAISIMSHIYMEYPIIVVREFGLQVGYIFSKLDLKKPDSPESLPEKWFDDLQKMVLLTTNKKLKLLKGE